MLTVFSCGLVVRGERPSLGGGRAPFFIELILWLGTLFWWILRVGFWVGAEADDDAR